MSSHEGALGRDYGHDELICRQGEQGDCAYVMQSGRAVVLREDGSGKVVVGQLSAGDIFGEMAIFERQPRAATVCALGAARVLTLDKKALMKRLHEDPSLVFRLLQAMSARIRRLDEEVARLKKLCP